MERYCKFAARSAQLGVVQGGSTRTMLRSGSNAGSSSMTERIAASAAARVAKTSIAKLESEEVRA